MAAYTNNFIPNQSVYGGGNTVSYNPYPSTQFDWVSGDVAAQAYNVMPGRTVVLMDVDSPTLYVKSADPMGKPLPMKVYDLKERDLSKPVVSPVDTSEFVKMEDVESMIEKKVNEVLNKRKKHNKKGDDR